MFQSYCTQLLSGPDSSALKLIAAIYHLTAVAVITLRESTYSTCFLPYFPFMQSDSEFDLLNISIIRTDFFR